MRNVAAVSCVWLGACVGLSAWAEPASRPASGVVVVGEPVVIRCEPPVVSAPFEGVRPSVDVAILLDTSNSMDGLIGQAKAQIWTLVRQFAQAEKNGQTPRLRVALFEYGNSDLPASEGYLRQVVPLSDDLDALSAALFGLVTNGGDEYCGQVIDAALTRLDWSSEPGGYKAIFIAGNEPFTQGPMDFRAAGKRAIEMGVVVNTIHCGSYRAGVDGFWQEGARLAEGRSLNIDQDRAVLQIECPQDGLLLKLNAALNETYLWFGRADDREAFAENQLVQDANAAGLGVMSVSERVATKATAQYRNVGRDLVDTALAAGLEVEADVLPATLPVALTAETLPLALAGLSESERVAKVAELATRRAALVSEIAALSAEREAYLAEARRAQAEEAGATLGEAMVSAVREQLADRGFVVE